MRCVCSALSGYGEESYIYKAMVFQLVSPYEINYVNFAVFCPTGNQHTNRLNTRVLPPRKIYIYITRFVRTMSFQILGYLEIINYNPSTNSSFYINPSLLRDTPLSPTDGLIPLRKHTIVKIGRNAQDCQVLITDPSISSTHCAIWGILFDEESLPMCYIRDTSLNGVSVSGERLMKGVAYLLQDTDELDLWPLVDKDEDSWAAQVESNDSRGHHSHRSQSYPLLRYRAAVSRGVLEGIDKRVKQLQFDKCVDGRWQIQPRVLGNGTFGHVMVCQRLSTETEEPPGRDNMKKQSFAVKIIRMKPSKIDREAAILLSLNHPNIIKVYHTRVDKYNKLYIFQDLIPGGDLFSYLAKGECLTSIPETEALLIVYQILNALNYLHNHGVVHRDLKLDNILLMSPEPCTRVVLADFGIAKRLQSITGRMHTVVGTPEYCAPEVGFKANRLKYLEFSKAATFSQEQQGYDKKCDLWSLGVVTHIMLTGISPFFGDGSEKSIIENSKRGILDFSPGQWLNISTAGRDFVSELLQVEVNKRLDTDGAFAHQWIKCHSDLLTKIYNRRILPQQESKAVKNQHSNRKVKDGPNYSSCKAQYL